MGWVLDGGVRERALAIRVRRETASLFAGDAWLACLVGDAATVGTAIARDADWANRPGGPLAMPPLVAVTHSRLIQEDGFERSLLDCASLLLRHGADANGRWIDPKFPGSPLSALYGAAGRTHHAGMTKLLLDAGAKPDDDESLYHSVEAPDGACTRLLVAAGVRVTGANAIGRVLDYDRLDLLQLLLAKGGDARERTWVHHAILRGRSIAHVVALVDAGADLAATNADGVSLWHWAQMHGRADVVVLLRERGIEEHLDEAEAFVAAATRGDEATARAIQSRVPDVLAHLTPLQLQSLPRLAAIGSLDGVRTMLALGWPREEKAGWDATALNLAVYSGDAEMARLLLDHGADWTTRHGFGDNVLGTLSHASRSEDIEDSAPRDYLGCARTLIGHGVPRAAFRGYTFSDDIEAELARAPR